MEWAELRIERGRKRSRWVGVLPVVAFSLLSLGWFFLADPLRADVEFSYLFFLFGEWKRFCFQELFCVCYHRKDWGGNKTQQNKSIVFSKLRDRTSILSHFFRIIFFLVKLQF